MFNCNWLIIPFGSGSVPINEKTVAKEKLDANTAASLAIMQANSITPPVNYGQNAGYTENCVSSYAGNQELDMYWYHPDHLGSSSFITGIDGEVTQNIEYFPSGEVFVENHKNSYNTPYKFNGKEQDSETGYYYYYGARYYNPRVSLWLNVDPLADYNPFYNAEHYIDGQHNGGVYNSGNLNPYIYCYQSPIVYTDPNGKQVNAVKKYLSNLWNDWNPYNRAGRRMSGESERDQNRRLASSTMKNVNGAAKAAATKEVGHFALDVIGTVEPTPFADTTNAIWYAFEGNYKYAALSGIAIIPYVGDAGKIGKYGVKALNFATTLKNEGGFLTGTLKFFDVAMKDFHFGAQITRDGDKMTMEVLGYFENSNVIDDVSSLGYRNIADINAMLQKVAKSEGATELTIKYERSAGSSSKVKGHYFEKTYKLK